jgi:hypothetical protein
MKKRIYYLLFIVAILFANYTVAQPPKKTGIPIGKKVDMTSSFIKYKTLFPDLVLEPECVLISAKVGTPPRQGFIKDGSFRFKITQTITNYNLEVISNENQDYISIVDGTYTSKHTLPCYIRMIDKVNGATIYYSINGNFPSTQNLGYNLAYTTTPPIVCQ